MKGDLRGSMIEQACLDDAEEILLVINATNREAYREEQMSVHRNVRFVLSMAIGWLLLAGLFLLLQGTSPVARADPGRLFVSTTGSDTACTRGHPCNLQTALQQATDGDTIYVAAGTYTGTGAAVITITRSITLYGGWDGSASGPLVRDSTAHPTTLDGEGQRRVAYIGRHITVTMESLTVTNGLATDYGAGLYAQDTNLTLRHTIFYSNVANSLTSINTLGGGAYLRAGSLHLISSTFRANDACCNGCPSTQGGGLYIYGTLTATIENSLFEANDAWDGSGLMFDGGTRHPFLVRYTTFKDNGQGLSPGNGYGGYGSAMALALVEALVEDNTFVHNRAVNDAGAIRFSGGQLSLNRNLIANNIAYVASGIQVWHASPFTMTNNIIVDNRPGFTRAGGVEVRSDSTGTMLHNTIARNVGSYGGYGIEVRSGMPITLVNNILVGHTVGISVTAGNTATLEGTLWGTATWANETDWGGAGSISTGTVNIWSDPAFVNPESSDYHLASGSAAIDAGVDAGVTTDIDGDPRPIGAGYDIGADEFKPALYLCLPVVLKDYAG